MVKPRKRAVKPRKRASSEVVTHEDVLDAVTDGQARVESAVELLREEVADLAEAVAGGVEVVESRRASVKRVNI